MTPEQEKVRSLLVDTITLLCRNGLAFVCDIKLQGLLAVTIDSRDFFVVQIDEVLSENFAENQTESALSPQVAICREPAESQFQRSRFPSHKRPRTLTPSSAVKISDGLSESKSFCQQMSQSRAVDLQGEARFSEGFTTNSAQIKVEGDDDVLLVESSAESSSAAQGFDFANCELNAMLEDRKEDLDEAGRFHCRSMGQPAPSSASLSGRANRLRPRLGRKQSVQWANFDVVEWSGLGDQGPSVSGSNFGYEDNVVEDKTVQQQQQQQEVTDVHLHRLKHQTWSSTTTTSSTRMTATADHRYQHLQSSISNVGAAAAAAAAVAVQRSSSLLASSTDRRAFPSKRRSAAAGGAGVVFKPFQCRYPGCPKRFCHETHTRRHEREAHNFYRQRQKQFLVGDNSAATHRLLRPSNAGPPRLSSTDSDQQLNAAAVAAAAATAAAGPPLKTLQQLQGLAE